MSFDKVTPGKNAPETFNVVIEISANSDPIKYEVDKESGAVFVDRFMGTAMHYPANYGYVPQTLAGDGDPVDVLVMTPFPLPPGVVVACRPIGILHMEDESGVDGKVLAVPTQKLLPAYDKINSLEDIHEITLKQIQHFFEHYKDLESGKWVRLKGWRDAQAAREEIIHAIDAYRPAANPPEAPPERP
ncbi:MAG: inorganic diphosphatase [Delftia acidovorans]|jgi:inorganic pyrophosphatase|nr:inorganic diphosphatase [Delftia acidovorans]